MSLTYKCDWKNALEIIQSKKIENPNDALRIVRENTLCASNAVNTPITAGYSTFSRILTRAGVAGFSRNESFQRLENKDPKFPVSLTVVNALCKELSIFDTKLHKLLCKMTKDVPEQEVKNTIRYPVLFPRKRNTQTER